MRLNWNATLPVVARLPPCLLNRLRTAATVRVGKYLDAASYYSSLGLAMDVFWLVVVLVSWRCLTREFWRTKVVPGDPHQPMALSQSSCGNGGPRLASRA